MATNPGFGPLKGNHKGWGFSSEVIPFLILCLSSQQVMAPWLVNMGCPLLVGVILVQILEVEVHFEWQGSSVGPWLSKTNQTKELKHIYWPMVSKNQTKNKKKAGARPLSPREKRNPPEFSGARSRGHPTSMSRIGTSRLPSRQASLERANAHVTRMPWIHGYAITLFKTQIGSPHWVTIQSPPH